MDGRRVAGRRENRSVGFHHHVDVLPVADIFNAVPKRVTLLDAADALARFILTGQRSITRHPCGPVTQASTNPNTVQTMSEYIDLDGNRLVSREITRLAVGCTQMNAHIRTVGRGMRAAEVLGHREFVLTRFHPSA